MDRVTTSIMRPLLHVGLLTPVVILSTLFIPEASATPLTLNRQFIGDYGYISTGGTLRTGSDASGNFCAVTNSDTASLSGIPASATIEVAYLYWAGSGNTPDTTVTLAGQTVNSDQMYTDTFSLSGTNYNWFGGVADVTSIVATQRNNNYIAFPG